MQNSLKVRKRSVGSRSGSEASPMVRVLGRIERNGGQVETCGTEHETGHQCDALFLCHHAHDRDVVILCLGINLIWDKKIRVANMLPMIVIGLLLTYVPLP